MKKILIAAAAIALISTTAYADSLTATVSNEEIVIEQESGMPESMIAACYDEDGKLTYAGRVNALDGAYTIAAAESYETIKLYDIGVKSYDVVVTAPTAEPEMTAEPTVQPKPTLHPAYEREVDADGAFAVVDKVVSTINANNEEVYAVSCLYQGQQITVEVAQDVAIKSAPDAFGELEGMDASALETGDAIYYETTIAGNRVKGIYLIYRPADVFEGSSFYSYFTDSNKAGGMWSVVPYGGKEPSARYAYAFGVVAEKYDTEMTLYSHSGLAEDAIDIDFTDNTVTYVCDMEGKPELEVSRTAGIKKSRISKSGIDEDDNITYSDDYTYSLALVRLVDDTAADVVVYQNISF